MSIFRDTTTVIVAMCFTLVVACKGQQKQQQQAEQKKTEQQQSGSPYTPTDEPTVFKGVKDQSCAAEMMFGSYGSGIDSEAFGKTMTLIGKYNLQYTSTNIGREGETRLCLPLTELEKKTKVAFIDSLKKIAKGGQVVSVSIR